MPTLPLTPADLDRLAADGKAHGTITRGDTVRLCMIDGQAATRLLGRLVKKYPEFVREGTRRGAHYTWRGPTK